jgi:pimeloyl-ACP methyl ester carboxylesterase
MTTALLRKGGVRVAGIRSPLLESGPEGADEAVVCVHGNPGSSRDWEDLLGRIGGFARGVAIDLPGFGRAEKPETFDYTVHGYARHLEAALQALTVRRVHLVLHDFGGPWGLEWASGHGDAVASVTLINTGVLPGYRWHYLARMWRTPVAGEIFQATATRLAFGLLLKHGNPRALPKPFVDRIYADFDRGTKRAILKLYRATSDPSGASRRWIAALQPRDLPACVVWGRHDPYLPVRFAARQRAAFPRAEITVLDRSGHWPFVDDPEGVAAAVVPFLQRQLGG